MDFVETLRSKGLVRHWLTHNRFASPAIAVPHGDHPYLQRNESDGPVVAAATRELHRKILVSSAAP